MSRQMAETSVRQAAVRAAKECVEVARLPEGIGVRDSKAPDAGHLSVSP
jgi:hypothetical protein